MQLQPQAPTTAVTQRVVSVPALTVTLTPQAPSALLTRRSEVALASLTLTHLAPTTAVVVPGLTTADIPALSLTLTPLSVTQTNTATSAATPRAGGGEPEGRKRGRRVQGRFTGEGWFDGHRPEQLEQLERPAGPRPEQPARPPEGESRPPLALKPLAEALGRLSGRAADAEARRLAEERARRAAEAAQRRQDAEALLAYLEAEEAAQAAFQREQEAIAELLQADHQRRVEAVVAWLKTRDLREPLPRDAHQRLAEALGSVIQLAIDRAQIEAQHVVERHVRRAA